MLENVSFLIKNIQTDLFVLLHDDDFLYPNAIQELLKAFLMDSSVSISIGRTRYFVDGVKCSDSFDSLENTFYSRNLSEYKVYEIEFSFLSRMLVRDAYMVDTRKAQDIVFFSQTVFGRERCGDLLFFLSFVKSFPNSRVAFTPEFVSAYLFQKNSEFSSQKTTYMFFMVFDLNVSPLNWFQRIKFLYWLWWPSCKLIARDLGRKRLRAFFVSFWIIKKDISLISKVEIIGYLQFFNLIRYFNLILKLLFSFL
jgi:hypothetical protein